MPDDDQAAREARAAKLREQIERLKRRGRPSADAPDEPERHPGESPREFVERRMREIAEQEQEDSK